MSEEINSLHDYYIKQLQKQDDEYGTLYEKYNSLQQKVEQLEKESKIEEDNNNKIEKLIYNEEYRFSKSTLKNFTYEDRRLLDSNFKELANKINELIDEVNKLKEEK